MLLGHKNLSAFSDHNFSKSLLNSLKRNPLFLILLFSVLIRIIWIDAPVVRDEADGGYISMLWLRGYPLYSYSDSNRPPFFYFFYSLSNLFSPPNIYIIRIVTDIIFWISVVFFYSLVKDICGSKEAIVGTFFFSIFMNVPIFEGMMAISASIVTSLLVISFSACNRYFRIGNKSWLITSGLLSSAAYLILQDQLLGLGILFFYLLETNVFRGRKPKIFFKNFFILSLSFAIPILLTAIVFLFSGEISNYYNVLLAKRSLSGYFSAPFVYENVQVLKISEGLPLWVFGAVGSLRIFKGRNITLPLLWSVIMLVRVILPPDFPHHLLYLIPPAAILSSIGFIFMINQLKKWTRKAYIPVIFLLALLMAPVLLFSAVQYPTTNIKWEGFDWNNTWISDSDDQRVISQFIRSETKNGSVLIHGWLPEIYWLSEKMAPSLYVYTVNYPNIPLVIPLDEYASIVSQVKAGEFEMILIPQSFLPDEIINATKNTYKLTNSIIEFDIYELPNKNYE
jgi:hypothetical protein